MANSTFATASIPVTVGLNGSTTVSSGSVMALAPNSTVTLTNRRNGFLNTVPGNIAQCKSVTSPDDYLPGQFPLSAIDGSITTKWQPQAANVTSSLTVYLGEPFLPVTAFSFDWAQSPPAYYRVTFHNLSDTSSVAPVNVTSSANIAVSNPYDAASVTQIVPYSSNTTNVTLPEAQWSGRYATLEISGNQADNSSGASGATVAEWAIISSQGTNMNMRSI